MMAWDPVGIRQLVARSAYPMAGLVVDLARRALDLVEDYVLVEPGSHAVRQPQPRGMRLIQQSAGDFVLPGNYLTHALHLHEAKRGGELVHPEVEPLHRVVGLAVV